MTPHKLFYFRLFSLSLFLIVSSFSFAQIKHRSEDSIRNVINTTKVDTVKIENYMIMGFQLKPNLDSSVFYLKKGLELSTKINNHYKEVACLNLIGAKYFENGLLDSALSFFNRLLESSIKHNYTEAIANAYLNIGDVYKTKKQYPKALEYFHLSLKYTEDPAVYCNIADVYYALKQSDKALTYVDKGILISNENIKTADEYSKIGSYYALGGLLSMKGKIFWLQNKYKETIPIYEEALKIAELIHNDYNKLANYADLASIYNLLNDKINTEKYYNKAFEFGAVLNNELLTFSLKSNYVEFLLKNRKYSEAENSLKELIVFFNSKPDKLEYLVQCYTNYGALYAKTNRADKAITSYEKAAAIADTISTMNNTLIVAEMQEKYQSEKKEKENLELKQENLEKENHAFQQTIIIIVLLSFILILTAFVLLYLNRKKIIRAKEKAELEKNLVDLEQKALRLQMNPHFIFNALNSIQSFINENDSVSAKKYLAKFAKLMRLILENSAEPTISLQNEIDVLNNYLELTTLRFSNKFNFTFDIDSQIDTSAIEIPPMLLQPFVENAVLHGIAEKDDKGTINIGFKKKGNNIECTIEDNGIGRQKAMEHKQSSHKSTGMLVTEERLKIFSEKNNQEAKFSIVDLVDKLGNACGTKVIVKIPFQLS